MTKDVVEAVRILERAVREVMVFDRAMREEDWQAMYTLKRAIRHLAYPDRDVYPKTRRATKGAPIVRK